MNPNDDEILNAIYSSGYLFEQDIATIFENNNFFVETNVAFKDIDEDKSREIDVVAYRNFIYDTEKKLSVSVRVICECKNNSSPFVFICRNKNKRDAEYIPPNFLFPQGEFRIPVENKPNHFYVKSAFSYYNLNTIFPFHSNESKAVQFCKIIRKGKEWSAFHDGIYDGLLIPVVKCLEYFKKKDDLKNDWKSYIIYYPIVLLNSDIYSINSNELLKKVNQINKISFIRDIQSKMIKGTYLIDFVNKDGLSEYIENDIFDFVNKFIKSVVE